MLHERQVTMLIGNKVDLVETVPGQRQVGENKEQLN